MDRQKYSAISHQGMCYCNPFSVSKMEEIVALLDLSPEARALDIGAGKAELLIRLVEVYGITALGLDLSAALLQEAQEQAAARLPRESLELRVCDASQFQAEADAFDFVACLGASHIYGGHVRSLAQLFRFVRPGGQLLVGEGYWKREPDPAYLSAMEAMRDECLAHMGNVNAGVALGLLPIYSAVCSDDDWDRYEWLRVRNIERYARQHPGDPDVPAFLTDIRAWRDIYLKWGRDTLGFGLYLFQKESF